MSYVVTFTDYTPGPRDDAQPWTSARIEEAGTAGGPWALIDTVTLSPVDTDPANPAARSFTTHNATLPAGWYRIVWLDDVAREQPTAPEFNGGAVTPSVQQVASFLRARTIGDGGGQTGTFLNATDPGGPTDPTRDQVGDYIAEAAGDVIAEVGRVIPAGAQDLFRRVVTIGAALLVEVNSEQVNEARYDRLKTLYDERLARLNEAVQEVDAGGDPGDVDDRVMPLGLFPAATPLDW